MIRVIVCILTLLCASPAISKDSEQLSIILGGWSHHFSKTKFKQEHENKGLEFVKVHDDVRKELWTIQTFKNSVNYRSYLLGYGETKINWIHKSNNIYCEYGYAVGVMHSRYTTTINTPLALPIVGCNVGIINIKTTVIPEFSFHGYKNPNIIFGYLTINWRF